MNQPGAHEGADNSEVVSALADELGRTPSIYALFAYDAVRIVGNAITEGGSSSSADVAAEISRLAEPYDGVSGPVRFNVAGDRDGGPYDVWKLSGGAWAMTGQYDTTTEHPVVLTPEETRWLEENRTIRVAYDPNWYPIEYIDEDGLLCGATGQYMQEFERLLGVDFVPISVNSWSQALDSIRTGEADVTFQVTDTEERREYMGFTTPHYTYQTVLATLHDGDLDVGAEGFRLITIQDYSIEGWLDANRPDIEYVSAKDHFDALGMLEAGEGGRVHRGVDRHKQPCRAGGRGGPARGRDAGYLARSFHRVRRRQPAPGLDPAKDLGQHTAVRAGADAPAP